MLVGNSRHTFGPVLKQLIVATRYMPHTHAHVNKVSDKNRNGVQLKQRITKYIKEGKGMRKQRRNALARAPKRSRE